MTDKKTCRFCGASAVLTPGQFCVNCGALHEDVGVASKPLSQRAEFDAKRYDHNYHSEELMLAESVLNDVDGLIGRVKAGDDTVSVENLLVMRLDISALVEHMRRHKVTWP